MSKPFINLFFRLTGIEGWRFRQLVEHGIKYGHFSFNINSKNYWDERFSKLGDFWRNDHYFYILDLFPKTSRFSLLDIGCGMGDGCQLIQQTFPEAEIAGADISGVAIEKARRRNNQITYYMMDILRDPISNLYDYITIVETLEHFDNPFMIVDKCLQYINNSLIVSVPYSPSYTGPINRKQCSEHRFAFNEKTFRGYDSRVVKVTDFIKATRDRCIIYSIFP